MAGIFQTHYDAAIIASLTGIGDVLGAKFLALVGGSLAGFASADHLAGYVGLARPRLPHWQNLHRPQRYNRRLQRVFFTSAMISIQRSPASKAYDDGKRAQGKRHTQAVLALAPTPRQRALGHAPLPPFLPGTTALTCARRMTNRIEGSSYLSMVRGHPR